MVNQFINHQLSNLDIVSDTIGFKNRGSKNYKTTFGGIISILYVICILIISCLLGKELFEKKIPITGTSKIYLEESKFNLKENHIFFNIADPLGIYLYNWQDYFEITSNVYTLDNFEPIYIIPAYKAENCTLEHYSVFKDILKEEQINDLLNTPNICINYDDKANVINKYSANSTCITLDFKYKFPFYTSNFPEDWDLKKDDFLVYVNYINNIVNPYNFDNPVIHYIDTYEIITNSKSLKTIFMDMIYDTISTDNNLVFESKEIINIFL